MLIQWDTWIIEFESFTRCQIGASDHRLLRFFMPICKAGARTENLKKTFLDLPALR